MDFIQSLLKYPLQTFREGRLVSLGPVPGEVIVGIGVVMAIIVWLLYRKVSGKVSRRSHRLLVALRVVQIAVICLLLAALGLETLKPKKNTVFTAVLVDASRSMSIPDAVGPDGKGSQSRADAARAIVLGGGEAQDSKALLARLGESSSVKVYVFDDGSRRIADAAALKAAPQGQKTNFFKTLKDLDADLRGLNLASVVMLTDGCQNAGGNASEAAGLLARRGASLNIIGLGNPSPPKDYEVRQLYAPRKVRRNSEVDVTAIIRHSGYSEPFEITISRVGAEKDVLLRQQIVPSETNDVEQVKLTFTPDYEGTATYRVAIAQDAAETLKDNNARDFTMATDDDRLPVLYVEGSPRPEYRFLRRALFRDKDFRLVGLLRLSNDKTDAATRPAAPAAKGAATAPAAGQKLRYYVQGANVSEAYLDQGFPRTREQLFAFQALILGDIEADFFTAEQLAMIEEFARARGGGVLMLGGVNSFGLGKYARTPLAKMLPVSIADDDPPYNDEEFRAKLPPKAVDDPLMRLSNDPEINKHLWENVPPLIGITPVSGLKAGATLLLTNEKNQPVLASQQYGSGRVAAFTSGGSWYWQMSMPASDEFHERFWKQMIRWLSVGAKERLSVETLAESSGRGEGVATTDVFERNMPVLVRATVLGRDLMPINDAAVTCVITDPFGNSQDMRMDWVLSEEGVYQARYITREEGDYTISVSVAGDNWKDIKPLETRFHVAPPVLEFCDAGLKEQSLRQLAQSTQGKYYTQQQAGEVAADVARAIKQANDAGQDKQRRPIWDMPLLFGLLLALFAVEWFIRRRSGLA
jgi:uncharacterized membrane protein